MEQERHLFCFGLGYTARVAAEYFLEKGWRVSGTCRTMEKCESFRQHGIVAHLFDNDLPLVHPEELQSVTHILHSIPPSEDGDLVLKYHLDDLKKLPDLKWVGYLSTTGVYGDCQGKWVDETSKPKPTKDRSERRVQAEKAWLKSGLPAHIFRLSGIYGEGRNVIKALQDGVARRIDKKGQVFSRIHVEDIVRILAASMQKPNPGAIYNCADDLPAPQAEVVSYAAELLGVEPPPLVPFDEAPLSEMARSFYKDNRKVRNKRIKKELSVELQYPTYKEGLQALI